MRPWDHGSERGHPAPLTILSRARTFARVERMASGRSCDSLELAVRPQADRRNWMAGFLFRLETVEGDPAQPSTLECAVPTWSLGDRIHLGLGHRTLIVVGKRDDDADRPPVLVVEEGT
jgi:hypothetical protein